jgi:hypothetical protein
MTSHKHLGNLTLDDFVRGNLTESESAVAQQHIYECQECSLRLAFSDAMVENLYREMEAAYPEDSRAAFALVA